MNKEDIMQEIHYEKTPGMHSVSMCGCGRMRCRGAKCVLCLQEDLDKIGGRE